MSNVYARLVPVLVGLAFGLCSVPVSAGRAGKVSRGLGARPAVAVAVVGIRVDDLARGGAR